MPKINPLQDAPNTSIFEPVSSVYYNNMTYIEFLLGLLKKMNEMIEQVNNNTHFIEEYDGRIDDVYNELDAKIDAVQQGLMDYVNNYFATLDIQEEINIKLDDMAQQGQLTDIIAQYLQLAGILAYNTVADMVNATNIVAGSTCRTLGELNYLDGNGHFYKIREITNDDVVDGVHIIEITSDHSNRLIAELIPDGSIRNKGKKYIFIGDSYNTTDTPTGGVPIVPWGLKTAEYLNLNSEDYYNVGLSGAGYARATSGTFLSLLQGLNLTEAEREEITDIVVMGGINDNNQTDSAVYDAVVAFSDYVKANYPNAVIHTGVIGWQTNRGMDDYLEHESMLYNRFACIDKVNVIGGSVGWCHNYAWIQPDGGHMNENGSGHIGYMLANYLKGGNPEMSLQVTSKVTPYENSVFTNSEDLFNIVQSIQGETLTIDCQSNVNYNTLSFKSNVTQINLTETNSRWSRQIGTISGDMLFKNNVKDENNSIHHGVASIIKQDNTYYEQAIPYAIHTYNNNVYLELYGAGTIPNPKFCVLKPITTNLTTAVTRL